MIAPLILAAQVATLCPPSASAVAVTASVSVVPNYVRAGESVRVRVALSYLPYDPITLGTNGTYGGGTATLSMGGVSINVTPAGGIPQIGPCGLIAWHTDTTVLALQSGPIFLDYVGQAGSYQARASSLTFLNVYPHGRMHIEGNTIWWYGQQGKAYTLQGSDDARSWIDLAELSPVNGLCSFAIATNAPHKLYRYHTLP